MANFNCNILLAILAAIVLVGIIYYFNSKAVPNDGTIMEDDMMQEELPQEIRKMRDPTYASPMRNNVMDDLFAQYEMDGSVLASDPAASNHHVIGGKRSNQLNNLNHQLSSNSSESDTRDFIYKKQKFTRRTQADINDQFDVEKMLPQENEDGWFDASILQNAKKIKGTSMINPKEHIGINTVGTNKKNPNLDIRGDISIPKIDMFPWNNSTKDYDANPNGLCRLR